MRFTAAVWDTQYGSQDPKIQIWREDKTRPGLYHKISSNNIIQRSNPPCIQMTYGDSVFQCTLREDFRISVQPGDFLGLEIPSWANDDLVIYFKAGGPTSLVFQDQLGSTVDLFTKSHTIANHEPQITFLVVLGKNFSCNCYRNEQGSPINYLYAQMKVQILVPIPFHQQQLLQ